MDAVLGEHGSIRFEVCMSEYLKPRVFKFGGMWYAVKHNRALMFGTWYRAMNYALDGVMQRARRQS